MPLECGKLDKKGREGSFWGKTIFPGVVVAWVCTIIKTHQSGHNTLHKWQLVENRWIWEKQEDSRNQGGRRDLGVGCHGQIQTIVLEGRKTHGRKKGQWHEIDHQCD